MPNMNKEQFENLPVDEKWLILKEKAEFVYANNDGVINISLYVLDGFYVEEYRNIETKELIKIEPIPKEIEYQRLNFYSQKIDPHFENNKFAGFDLKEREDQYIKVECVPCGYEFFSHNKDNFMRLVCPVCNKHHFKFSKKIQCGNCNKRYFPILNRQKEHRCPYCNNEDKVLRS